MPVIHFYGPKMTKEQKENLVKEFAATSSKVTNIPAEKFVTLIHEMGAEDVGNGTQLLVNTNK